MVSYEFFLFRLKGETSTRRTNSMPFLVFRRDHLRSTSGSFAVRDHLRSSLGIISGLGIICGRGSSAVLYRSATPNKKQRRSCSEVFQGKVKMAPLNLRLCVWFDSCEDRRLTKSRSSGVIHVWPDVKNAAAAPNKISRT